MNTTPVVPFGVTLDTTGANMLFPVTYARRTAVSSPHGWSGITKFIRWSGTTNTKGDTVGSKDWIIIGDVAVPWDGSTTPLT